MTAAWDTLRALRDEGRCRAIGVSNFTVARFERGFLAAAGEVPAVNQVEFHPFWYRADLLAYGRAKGIVTTAYSPLARARRMDHPVLAEIARARGRTVAQVMLRWCLEHGVPCLPKSADPARIRENADLFGWRLTPEQTARIDALNEDLSVISYRPCPPEAWY
jgi:diketogulonate reductase-like aldo/keto reductase